MLKRVSDAYKIYDKCHRCIGEVGDENVKLLTEVERLKNASKHRLCDINSNDTDSVDSEHNNNSDVLNSDNESDVEEDLNNTELFGLKKDF